MLNTGGDSSITQWVTRVPYYRRPFRSPGVYVSDKGDFFIRVSSNGDITIFRKDRSTIVRENSQFGPSIFGIATLYPSVEEVRGVDVLRLRNLEYNRWDAYNTVDASVFQPTLEDLARWNEVTREEILEKLYAAQREELRRKAMKISAPLARLAGRGATNQIWLTENDYLFLATLRNPADRKWIEQRVEDGAPMIVQRLHALRGGASVRQPYFFEYVDRSRAEYDWMLGFWDQKASWSERSTLYIVDEPTFDKTRYTLGKVTGTVRLPMPMPIYRNSTQATLLHIRLIPDAKERREERIDARIGFENARDRRRVYEAKFAFTTVLPGSYQLKAIWDKRSPHSDTNNARPGDYETVLTAPFTVTAGATITNLLHCTNRIAGGEAYYRADEIFERQWIADHPAAPSQ